MGTFARAIVSGFGFSLGAALFRRVSGRLGLEREAYGTANSEKESAPESESESQS